MRKTIIIILGVLSSLFSAGQSKTQLTDKSDTIFVTLSDKLFFEAEVDTANRITFKKGSKRSDKLITISIRLNYNEATGSMLEVINPFDKQLFYKAELYSFKKQDYVETSTVPVFPKLSSFETWPFRIEKIRLTGFKLVKTEQSSQ